VICVAPPPRNDLAESPRIPYRRNDARPLWFVRTMRSAADWQRCERGRRLAPETADLLLDHVFEQIAGGCLSDGVACLVDGLDHLARGARAGSASGTASGSRTLSARWSGTRGFGPRSPTISESAEESRRWWA
jgi:hypothetical protein